ncbi:MAG TPA: hypothetical protein VFM25_12970 [Verrucomicrobiae bacterium]|nr:hypothetical protein [Verrucomicrobiae bacterium]
MFSILPNLQSRFSRWRAWEPNPIIVKELRQSVRSRFLAGSVALLLAALFFTSVVCLAQSNFYGTDLAGLSICRDSLLILTGASLFIIPFHIAGRLALERQESNLDLIFATALSSLQIIRGKFLAGAYLAVIFFSICMPFMMFATTLGGVDFRAIIVVLVSLYCAVCFAIQAAIFVACFSIPWALKIIVGFLFGIGLLFLTVALTVLFSGVLIFGFTINNGPGLWSLISIILSVAAVGYFQVLSVAAIARGGEPGLYWEKTTENNKADNVLTNP